MMLVHEISISLWKINLRFFFTFYRCGEKSNKKENVSHLFKFLLFSKFTTISFRISFSNEKKWTFNHYISLLWLKVEIENMWYPFHWNTINQISNKYINIWYKRKCSFESSLFLWYSMWWRDPRNVSFWVRGSEIFCLFPAMAQAVTVGFIIRIRV